MGSIEVRPNETCGAEVLGVDLGNLSVAEFDQIQAAFSEHGVLFFRDQELSERQHIGFAERWGEIKVNRFSTAHLDHPEIALVAEEAPESFDIGGAWRADQSYVNAPALGSVLVARELPSTGGHTMFASMYAAYESLDSATKHRIERLQAIHSARHVFGEAADSMVEVLHPMVIAHPLSGKKALFVNPSFTIGIDGMERSAAMTLLHGLYEHARSADFVTKFSWAPGSVVFWDNRAVWHNAFNEHSGQHRVMHRVTVEGCPVSVPIDHQRAEPTLAQKAGATLAGGLITAAMDGIGIVIEPERTRRPDIEIVGEAPDDEPDESLHFGDLPPL